MRALLLTVLLAFAAPAPQTEPNVIQGSITRAGTKEGIADAQVTLGVAAPAQFVEAFMKAALEDGATPAQAQAVMNQLLSGTPEYFQQMSTSAPPGIAPLMKQMQAIRDTNPNPTLPATSDATGHFILKNVQPGAYTLTVRRDGYFSVSNATNCSIATGMVSVPMVCLPVTVTAQQPLLDINVPMVHGALISGTVRDSAGQPAVGINVVALQLGYTDGRAVWNTTISKRTDDRGQYRLFWLAPGEYAVAATPPMPVSTPNPKDSWIQTFYPGTIDPQSAQRLVVKEGDELTGMNIDFRMELTVKVSGQVVNTLPNAPRESSLHLLPRDLKQSMGDSPSSVTNTATDHTNGQFEIKNVTPGSYDLVAVVFNNDGKRFATITPIEVGTGDLQNVTVHMNSGTDVKARLTVLGETPAPGAAPLKVMLRPLDSSLGQFESLLTQTASSDRAVVNGAAQTTAVPVVNPVDGTGMFTFSNVSAARYTFRVEGLPDTAYVADIRKGDASIFDSGFLAGSDTAAPIEIIVNLAGITVEGTVRDAAGKAVANATVVLAPPQSRRGNRTLYKKVTTDDSGHFRMAGVAPGEYKVFAWETAPPESAHLNSEFMAAFEDRGQALPLSADSNPNLQVLVIH